METFQQPKVTGYRQLSAEEAALMNEIKAQANSVGVLCDRLVAMAKANPDGVDARWVAVGQTDLQKGFMSLVRSVARPTSF